MNVAIIPARGGSKRIPRKNIRSFLGKPIIAYSIEAARDAGMFDRIIVSTDDKEIAEVANAHGAETPFLRPAEISDDKTGTAAVIKHALNWLQEAGTPPCFSCCIYATAPFIQPSDLQDGFERLSASSKAFAFSVTSFPFPIQRALKLAGDGVEPFSPEHVETRSQDLEEAFHDAGQFYWGRVAAFLTDSPIFTPSSIPIILPRNRVQDIDTEEDWLRAEHLYRVIQMSATGS